MYTHHFDVRVRGLNRFVVALERDVCGQPDRLNEQFEQAEETCRRRHAGKVVRQVRTEVERDLQVVLGDDDAAPGGAPQVGFVRS